MNELITTLARTEKQLQVRNHIDAMQHCLEEKIKTGEFKQTLYNAHTEEGTEQADHFFGHKVYGRGLWIPAGTVVVGILHKYARICVIASGKCTFTNEYTKKTVTAPWVGEFSPGSKTAVYAHEDTYWLLFVGTELIDALEIIDEIDAGSPENYEKFILEHYITGEA